MLPYPDLAKKKKEGCYGSVSLTLQKLFYHGCQYVNLHDNASSHKCEVKSFLASEKVKVLNHPPYSPDLSLCDFFLFPRLKKMLSGNKYTSRNSLGSAIYQCLQQIPKEDNIFICLSQLGKKVTEMCFSKGGILWRFVIKICLIKRSPEVIRTQWQNFLQDPHSCTKLMVTLCKIRLTNQANIFFGTLKLNNHSKPTGIPCKVKIDLSQ